MRATFKILVLTALFITMSATMAPAKEKRLSARQIETIIVRAAKKSGVPAHLLLAVCWIESHYKTHLSEAPDGKTPSYGICQVKLETAQYMDFFYKHKYRATPQKLRDPYINALYASKYIQYQLKRYDNDWKKAVAAYNQGSFYDRAPNSKYVKKVELAFEERELDKTQLDNL